MVLVVWIPKDIIFKNKKLKKWNLGERTESRNLKWITNGWGNDLWIGNLLLLYNDALNDFN